MQALPETATPDARLDAHQGAAPCRERIAGQARSTRVPAHRPTGRIERAEPLASRPAPQATVTRLDSRRPVAEAAPSLALALRVFALALAVLIAWSEFRHAHPPRPAATPPAAERAA